MPITCAEGWAQAIATWHTDHALPLWARTGIDPATATSWEALDHNGTPLPDLNRRQRVQFRQANVFARSADEDLQALGWQMFRHTMDHGFDSNTGLFSAWVTPDLRHMDQTHDLYDLAFGVLAAASLGHAGFDVGADITRLEEALNVLRAPLGWHETPDHRLPRRQNPHMHLFEATTALYALTSDPTHLRIAQECLEIIADHALLHESATLLEFFAPDWTPLTGSAQAQEPGHLAEWIYLADNFATVTGISTGLPLTQMWNAVLDHRLPSGFLPDVTGGSTRRLWPQTELLKAATVMQRSGHVLPAHATPEHIAARLWDVYMDTPAQGGWFDSFDETTGTLLSTNMPASTFYHIDLAIEACQTVSG